VSQSGEVMLPTGMVQETIGVRIATELEQVHEESILVELLGVQIIRGLRPDMVLKTDHHIVEQKVVQQLEEEHRIIPNNKITRVHRTISLAHVDRLI
jgi:hypothetical protein